MLNETSHDRKKGTLQTCICLKGGGKKEREKGREKKTKRQNPIHRSGKQNHAWERQRKGESTERR